MLSQSNKLPETKDQEFIKAKAYAYRLLGYRQRSATELVERLEKRGFSTSSINRAIENLRQSNYLNDAEFARFWIRSRLEAHPVAFSLLRYQLKQKGIDRKTIEETIGEFCVQYDELELARGLALKRRNRYKDVEPLKLKKRLYDFLRRRGFSDQVIYQVLE